MGLTPEDADAYLDADTDADSLVLLAMAVEPGDAGVGRRLRDVGAVELVSQIRTGRSGLRNEEAMARRIRDLDAGSVRESARRCDARLLTRADHEWPSQLDALGPTAPIALWVRGAADLRLIALRSVAVVGARACTAYGEEVARDWSASLADAEWTVVSGAAFGIDAAAHRGALAAGGVTVAVVAGGVDVAYPREHQSLLDRIADDGLVVSEAPPGESVRRQRFLSRNRVIAALTRATVVIEAAERSGTRATARVAATLSRPVAAVPGPVTSPASAGCHRMIRESDALLVSDVGDLLSLLDLGQAPGASGPVAGPAHSVDRDRLPARERVVLDAVPARGSVGLDALVMAARRPAVDVLTATGLLVAGGWLDEVEGGWRLTRRPRA